MMAEAQAPTILAPCVTVGLDARLKHAGTLPGSIPAFVESHLSPGQRTVRRLISRHEEAMRQPTVMSAKIWPEETTSQVLKPDAPTKHYINLNRYYFFNVIMSGVNS
jgi:hypothetical protein